MVAVLPTVLADTTITSHLTLLTEVRQFVVLINQNAARRANSKNIINKIFSRTTTIAIQNEEKINQYLRNDAIHCSTCHKQTTSFTCQTRPHDPEREFALRVATNGSGKVPHANQRSHDSLTAGDRRRLYINQRLSRRSYIKKYLARECKARDQHTALERRRSQKFTVRANKRAKHRRE